MSFSDVYEKKVLEAVFGKGTVSPPANYFIALCESAPVDGDDSISIAAKEATYTGYARVSTAPGDWSAVTGTNPTQIENANQIDFPSATGGSSTVTHFAILAVDSGAGDMILHGALSQAKAITSGDMPQFLSGNLVVTQD